MRARLVREFDSVLVLLRWRAIRFTGMDEEFTLKRRKQEHQMFRLGDTVRILSGPFAAFTGKIEGINQSKALLKVTVKIYGRNEPIKLNFADVEVLSFS